MICLAAPQDSKSVRLRAAAAVLEALPPGEPFASCPVSSRAWAVADSPESYAGSAPLFAAEAAAGQLDRLLDQEKRTACNDNRFYFSNVSSE